MSIDSVLSNCRALREHKTKVKYHHISLCYKTRGYLSEERIALQYYDVIKTHSEHLADMKYDCARIIA
ncbi:hypothetical protein EB796_006814 [Bugula neritina]|uniref:Uncharacterized protein n=1 Tax=Bugula neritina TaxID=10212 RepID=A0A7J7KA90_BUGNE|nr:hypothetical protein EB796_006814 [Bugula neritina]